MSNRSKTEKSTQEILVHPVEKKQELMMPTPRIDLHDAHAIRRELSTVYRDMRMGQIETQTGTRLAYVLDMIRKAYDLSILQDRIELLERIVEVRKKRK